MKVMLKTACLLLLAADFSSTTLIELTGADGPQPALAASGYIYGVARVR